MSSTLEYTYDYNTEHLDDNEALEKYRREKIQHPDALIVLDDLDCGHWEVKVYDSNKEKEVFLKKKVDFILERFFSVFKKK